MMEDKNYEFIGINILKQGTPKYYKSICPECGCEFLFLKSETTFCMSNITCPQCKNDYVLPDGCWSNPTDISGNLIITNEVK